MKIPPQRRVDTELDESTRKSLLSGVPPCFGVAVVDFGKSARKKQL
jgi:hypothetical protein